MRKLLCESFHDRQQLFIRFFTGGSINNLQVAAVHYYNHMIISITVKAQLHPNPSMKLERLFFQIGLDNLQLLFRQPQYKIIRLVRKSKYCFIAKHRL